MSTNPSLPFCRCCSLPLSLTVELPYACICKPHCLNHITRLLAVACSCFFILPKLLPEISTSSWVLHVSTSRDQVCEGVLMSTAGLGQAPGRVSLGQSWTLATMSGSTAALQVYHPTLPVLPSFLAAHFLKILSYRVWRRTGLTVAGDCYP